MELAFAFRFAEESKFKESVLSLNWMHLTKFPKHPSVCQSDWLWKKLHKTLLIRTYELFFAGNFSEVQSERVLTFSMSIGLTYLALLNYFKLFVSQTLV